jgi:hypothetical protein
VIDRLVLRPASLASLALAGAAIAAAFLAGSRLAGDVTTNAGLLAGICLAPVLLIDLPLGLGLWIALVFVQGLPTVNVGENAAAALAAVAWIGLLASPRSAVRAALLRHRVVLLAAVPFLVWMFFCVIWATDRSQAGTDLKQWYSAAYLFPIVATVIASERDLKMLLSGFVLGGVVSVSIGFLANDLTSSGSFIDRATDRGARLQGGEGDPNYLAAGLVPAIALAGGLLALVRTRAARLALVIAMGVMTAGLAATVSRGGYLAALVALVIAVMLLRGRRRHVLALVVMLLAIGGTWLVNSPTAIDRVAAASEDEGSGRTEIWTVAWRIAEDHPIRGVGPANFGIESPRYVRRPGALGRAELLAETPVVVHNVYLQLWAETGIIGLSLFAGFVGVCLATARRAAKRFHALGAERLATTARTLLIGQIGMLTASIFLSNGSDKRLWVLFALGPAMLSLASRLEHQRLEATLAEPGGPPRVGAASVR